MTMPTLQELKQKQNILITHNEILKLHKQSRAADSPNGFIILRLPFIGTLSHGYNIKKLPVQEVATTYSEASKIFNQYCVNEFSTRSVTEEEKELRKEEIENCKELGFMLNEHLKKFSYLAKSSEK